MIRPVPMALLLSAPLLALSASAVARGAAQDELTVYRCTDAAGKLTLQDKPCAKGQAQQARQMQKLKDPPAKPVPAPSALTPAPAVPPPVNIVVRTPQPLYECVRADNSVYTSDDGEGDPRWVPAWDPYGGYPFVIGGGGIGVTSGGGSGGSHRGGGGSGGAIDMRGGGGGGNGAPQLQFRNSPSSPPPPPGRPPRPPYPGGGYGYGYSGAGYWERDACHALPQREVCDRLVDRRDEIRRRFFNAQPSERAVLSREERGINARLAADCGDR